MAGGLSLAAAPTFALMAALSAAFAPGMAICAAGTAFPPIDAMALMYVLMGFFHLPPWLALLRNVPHRRITQAEGD